MKSGENLLVPLIDQRVALGISGLKGLYRAEVVATSPLTVQPRALTADGKKQTAVRKVAQLDLGALVEGTGVKVRGYKVGDEVLVGVITEGTANFKKGKDYHADPYRINSVDSSIVLGVIK